MRKMKRKFEENERFFSVELKSKVNLKNITLTNGAKKMFWSKAVLASYNAQNLAEGIILEVVGDKGVLRINLSPDEITQKENQEKEE